MRTECVPNLWCNTLAVGSWYCNFPWLSMWTHTCSTLVKTLILLSAKMLITFCLSVFLFCLNFLFSYMSLCPSFCLLLHSSVDPDPSAAAAVDPAGPSSAPGCGCAALSQPAEWHHRGQHLSLCSCTHHPTAPVAAHPDCSSKAVVLRL